jgi:hypothetical protein
VSRAISLQYSGMMSLKAMNERCSMGSVISSHHLNRIDDMVARRQSGTILTGGKRMLGKSLLDHFDFSRGSFYPPTVISDVDVSHELWQEEIFGPVVVVKKFSVSYTMIRAGFFDVKFTLRLNPRELDLPMLPSTDWERESGLRICQELIELVLILILVLFG